MLAACWLLVASSCFERSPSADARIGDLASPWFEVRSRAQERLLALRPTEGQAIAEQLLRDPDPTLRLAGVEWYREQIEIGGAVREEPFAAAFAVETDPRVKERAIHVASAFPELIDRLRQATAKGEFPPLDLDALLDARLIRLCDAVLLDGGVPGFFDGQFRAMHSVDETALLRMLRFAWDPRLHPVMRTLMIMAMHEPRPSALELFLEPLLIPAGIEVAVQHAFKWKFDTTAYDVRQNLVATYSQYARFSLAKAGIAGPIDEKIAELRSRYLEYSGRARATERTDPDRAEFYLEEAMDFLFQVGYHHQQLDRYDAAEDAYRTIIAAASNVRSKRWAHYNLACIRAIQGRNDEAIEELTRAVAVGFNDVRWAARDGDLEPLRDDPRFQRLLAGLPAEAAEPPSGEGR